MRKIAAALMILFTVSISYGQDMPEREVSKKEQRKERKRVRKAEIETMRKKGLKALQDRDFTLRANMFINSDNESISVSEDTNYLMIDGDEIYIYQGVAAQGMFLRNFNIQGKITKMKIQDHGEGKRVDAVIYLSSPYLFKPLTVFLSILGENNEARLVFGTDRFKMRGAFVRTSESSIQTYPVVIPQAGTLWY